MSIKLFSSILAIRSRVSPSSNFKNIDVDGSALFIISVFQWKVQMTNQRHRSVQRRGTAGGYIKRVANICTRFTIAA